MTTGTMGRARCWVLGLVAACNGGGGGTGTATDGGTSMSVASTSAGSETSGDVTSSSSGSESSGNVTTGVPTTSTTDGGETTTSSTGVPGLDCDDALASGWGAGDDVGTLDGDAWTPGRDGDGRVNCVSWQTVPTGRWVRVVGTRLDALDAEVKAAIPGWNDRGNEDWHGVLADGVGMAWDTRKGTERGWVTVGGGHDGSSNDGVYRLDLRAMKWNIERMPSDSSKWPEAYSANFTNFNPAVEYYENNPGNPEGVYSDEFFDPDNPEISSRTPTSRHTYGSTVFVPELGNAGKILMGCRRYWEYDVETATWALPKFPFDAAANYSGETGYTGENMNGWWNAAEGRYYVSATQNYTQSQTWSVLAGGTDFRWEGGYPTGGWTALSIAQDQRGQTLHSLVYEGGRPHQLLITDIDTREIVSHELAYGPSTDGLMFDPQGGSDGGTLAHVAETGQYLTNFYPIGEGMLWAWIDEATWTLERAQIEGDYPAEVNFNTETKLEYFPEMHAIVWVNVGEEDIRLIRLQ